MKQKLVSLIELIKLVDDPQLSEKYINYLCSFDDDRQYRHDEINAIKTLVHELCLSDISSEGFLYSYSIRQLNKEFDLLKISGDYCINIEIKTFSPGLEKIKNQLLKNRHYLKLLKKEMLLFAFVEDTKTFYSLLPNDELVVTNKDDVASCLIAPAEECIDLDYIFSPKNVLVSPLNNPQRFLDGDYILTDNQKQIKKRIVESVESGNQFVGLCGLPGTGKTLLLYDIAFDYAQKCKVLVFHCGIMCSGHFSLNQQSNNLSINEVKILRLKDIKGYDIVFVDESHRIFPSQLEKIIKWVPKANAKCIFSFDESQRLSLFENNSQTLATIYEKCGGQNIFKLTNKIRTNKEIAYFIVCLRDLSKCNKRIEFQNIRIIYEPDDRKSVSIAKRLEEHGYKYISYTPSTVYYDLNYQKNDSNTHRVIGQEFDGVTMIINHNFFYKGNKLDATAHPNPDYLYTQLLYQGLTRARERLCLIIQEKSVLQKIFELMQKSKEGNF